MLRNTYLVSILGGIVAFFPALHGMMGHEDNLENLPSLPHPAASNNGPQEEEKKEEKFEPFYSDLNTSFQRLRMGRQNDLDQKIFQLHDTIHNLQEKNIKITRKYDDMKHRHSILSDKFDFFIEKSEENRALVQKKNLKNLEEVSRERDLWKKKYETKYET